ncbi:hypothetical protein B0J12DRAFT_394405 [Macrophomina phaseolina]|uniref:Uncharacterized protein n=1 Tax=Macrophomina phaseolina TaxID=35725 RepID=A0ABQ8FUT8_9PEZI|nr:hypothetical protein B0J12DRAFT_394405 [Macrophomina phaseolina]
MAGRLCGFHVWSCTEQARVSRQIGPLDPPFGCFCRCRQHVSLDGSHDARELWGEFICPDAYGRAAWVKYSWTAQLCLPSYAISSESNMVAWELRWCRPAGTSKGRIRLMLLRRHSCRAQLSWLPGRVPQPVRETRMSRCHPPSEAEDNVIRLQRDGPCSTLLARFVQRRRTAGSGDGAAQTQALRECHGGSFARPSRSGRCIGPERCRSIAQQRVLQRGIARDGEAVQAVRGSSCRHGRGQWGSRPCGLAIRRVIRRHRWC